MKAIRAALGISIISALCIAAFAAFLARSHVPSGIPASTPDERMVYLFTQGWKGEEIGSDEVVIPESTDVVYLDFAQLQKAQGLPLARYAGCRAMRYTYRLAQSDLYAELVCADGILVGAMCYDPAAGEMYTIQGKAVT